MKKVRSAVTVAVVGVATIIGVHVGSGLIDDVRIARAESNAADAREGLKSLNDLSSAYKSVNRAMEQSVVQLIVEKKVRGGMMPGGPDFFDDNGDGPQLPQMPNMPQMPRLPGAGKEVATGSGVIMDAGEGVAFIVTNNHVVSDAKTVSVTLADGRQISDAEVVGTDPKTDVAVVKIKADRVIPAKWGDSDQLEKGDIIVAFGSPFGYVGSMSQGIVSSLNRRAGVIRSNYAYEDFIQVDAPINPGNSGGPLVNLKGEVVGINTAIASRTGSFAGIGFAIPANQARHVYDSLKSTGTVVRGYLGVQIADIKNARPDIRAVVESLGYKGENGVLISSVPSGGPASGVLKASDIITGYDGHELTSMNDLRNRVAETKPGTEVKLDIFRDKKKSQVSLKVAQQPDEEEMAKVMTPDSPGGIGLRLITPSASDLKAAGLSGDLKGALITEVMAGSPANVAGLAGGDLITSIGDQTITDADGAQAAFKKIDLSKPTRVNIVNKSGEKMVVLSNDQE